MYVCLCNAITQEELDDTIKENPTKSGPEIMDILKIGKGCGACTEVCMNPAHKEDDYEECYISG